MQKPIQKYVYYFNLEVISTIKAWLQNGLSSKLGIEVLLSSMLWHI